MRIILVLLIIGFCFSPAYAYKEDNRAGETQLTAGEQNTALHRLNNQSAFIIKKLKKADEFVARRRSIGEEVVASDFEGLLNSEQEDKKQMEMKKILSKVSEKVSQPRLLTEQKTHAVYENIENTRATQIKDIQVARALRQQIGRKP